MGDSPENLTYVGQNHQKYIHSIMQETQTHQKHINFSMRPPKIVRLHTPTYAGPKIPHLPMPDFADVTQVGL